ncbi:hypothetical protein BT69DRAFT_1280276, partial [Atractiella rhizophila]
MVRGEWKERQPPPASSTEGKEVEMQDGEKVGEHDIQPETETETKKDLEMEDNEKEEGVHPPAENQARGGGRGRLNTRGRGAFVRGSGRGRGRGRGRGNRGGTTQSPLPSSSQQVETTRDSPPHLRSAPAITKKDEQADGNGAEGMEGIVEGVKKMEVEMVPRNV